MAIKPITIYTPPDAVPHIYAEDDAQLHRAMVGVSGITLADQELALTIVNANTVRMAPGMYCMQGYMLSVQGGTSADLPVESGAAGAYRHDLVIAEFIRGGGATADTYTFRVLRGADAASAGAAQDPALTQDDLAAGGSTRQEAVYRLHVSPTGITSFDRLAEYIGNYGTHLDDAPTIGSQAPVSSGGTAQALLDNMPRVFAVTIPLASWEGSAAPYTFYYSVPGLVTQTQSTCVSAFFTDADSAVRPRAPIRVAALNGRLQFRTAMLPRGELAITVTVQKSNGPGNYVCIASGAGGGNVEFTTMTMASGLTGVTEITNSVFKETLDTTILALDITFNRAEVTQLAFIPEGFRPFFPETCFARIWDGTTETSPVTATILENGLISIPAATCTHVQLTAIFVSQARGTTTMTMLTTDGWSGEITEITNELTRDLTLGTTVGHYACRFSTSIRWQSWQINIPAGWGTTDQRSSIPLTATYSTDGVNYTTGTVYYYPNTSTLAGRIQGAGTASTRIVDLSVDFDLPVNSAQPPQ